MGPPILDRAASPGWTPTPSAS